MVDETEVEDEVPEREIVPIEDLDKIEKLLDVSLSTVNMPNLSHIKQSCMDELAQIDAALAEAQQEAQEAFEKEMAEYDAKQAEKRRAKEKEARLAAKKAEEERVAREEEAGRDPNAPQSLAGAPRDTVAQPVDPTGPSTVYPSEQGTIERRL